nr:PilW family protein [Halothiobacillus sp.]
CGNSSTPGTSRVANVLTNQTTDWWANWGNAVIGYDAGVADPAITAGMPARVVGTDSIALIGADGFGLSIVKDNATAATFFINAPTTNIQQGDIIIVCDPDHAAITQVTNYNSANVSLVHNTGAGVAKPGNCSKGLGFPTSCASTNGNGYTFGPNSQIAQLAANDWYIGTNSVGGSSLYRISLLNKATVPTPTAQEMVRNVTGMTIRYHISGGTSFVKASTVANWGNVDAVQVTLTLQSQNQRAGTDVKPIQRIFTATTTLRNRVN